MDQLNALQVLNVMRKVNIFLNAFFSGWQCTTSGENTKQTTSTTQQPTISIISTPSNSASNTTLIFPYCKFSFGIAYSSSPFDYSMVDYITVWIGWPTFNRYWEGEAATTALKNGKKILFYAYFIAFM